MWPLVGGNIEPTGRTDRPRVQVWSDLERVRQWTNVCVETTETGETVFLRGNAPKSSVEQSCSLADQPGSPADELVLPLRAACMFMPTEIMDQCRRTQVVTGSGLIVAIVADDSTVVYYRLKELDHGLNDLLTVELNYK